MFAKELKYSDVSSKLFIHLIICLYQSMLDVCDLFLKMCIFSEYLWAWDATNSVVRMDGLDVSLLFSYTVYCVFPVLPFNPLLWSKVQILMTIVTSIEVPFWTKQFNTYFHLDYYY